MNNVRISLTNRGLLFIATPLFLQAVQVFVLCELLSRAEKASASPILASVSSIKMCLGIGLVLTFFLFIGGIRSYSAIIIKRVQLLQENMQRVRQGLPLLEPIFGCDELSDLDAEFHELAASMQQKISIKQHIN